MRKLILIFITAVFGFSCLGTDEITVEDTGKIENEKIEVMPNTQAVLVGEATSFTGVYKDNMGNEQSVALEWMSSDELVAIISSEGVATGLKEGTVVITASVGSVVSDQVTLNVVEETSDLSKIIVSGDSDMVSVGESLQLSAKGYDLDDNEITDVVFEWSSDNELLATVDQNGEVMASVTEIGYVNITASSEMVNSNVYSLKVVNPAEPMVREGVLGGFSGYNVNGTVSLEEGVDGTIKLKFADNFLSQSGPGLYIYLSNSNSAVVANGIEIQAFSQTSGAFEVDISATHPEIELGTYEYVIIHCKPFNVPFGGAMLGEIQ